MLPDYITHVELGIVRPKGRDQPSFTLFLFDPGHDPPLDQPFLFIHHFLLDTLHLRSRKFHLRALPHTHKLGFRCIWVTMLVKELDGLLELDVVLWRPTRGQGESQVFIALLRSFGVGVAGHSGEFDTPSSNIVKDNLAWNRKENARVIYEILGQIQ